MKFIAIMRRSEMRSGGESKELKQIKFEAPSITAAKARATKEANRLVFFTEIQSWDKENRKTVGKDLQWQSWSKPPGCYTQDDGKVIGYSGKSATFFGLYTTESDASRQFVAGVTLYWEIKD